MTLPRPVLLAILLPFAALTVYAVAEVGVVGIFSTHQTPGGAQVFVDLVIALLLVMTWMVQDCRARGSAAWPWVLATLALGSFGPLAYLLLRGPAPATAPATAAKGWA